MLYGQSKLKALVTNIAMQRIKAVEAADMSDMLCTQWYITGMLIIITLGILYLVTNKLRKQAFVKDVCFLTIPRFSSLYSMLIPMSL